jgi:8-oxo-dGTP diphosphatase
MPDLLRNQIHEVYGERIRIRACGCLIENGKLLLLRHKGIGSEGFFWNVPGGEPERGETLKQAVEREFLEETGVKVKAGSFLCMNEYVAPPLHALEFYFSAKLVSGTAVLGTDPENVAVLDELKWLGKDEFEEISPDARPVFLTQYLKF